MNKSGQAKGVGRASRGAGGQGMERSEAGATNTGVAKAPQQYESKVQNRDNGENLLSVPTILYSKKVAFKVGMAASLNNYRTLCKYVKREFSSWKSLRSERCNEDVREDSPRVCGRRTRYRSRLPRRLRHQMEIT